MNMFSNSTYRLSDGWDILWILTSILITPNTDLSERITFSRNKYTQDNSQQCSCLASAVNVEFWSIQGHAAIFILFNYSSLNRNCSWGADEKRSICDVSIALRWFVQLQQPRPLQKSLFTLNIIPIFHSKTLLIKMESRNCFFFKVSNVECGNEDCRCVFTPTLIFNWLWMLIFWPYKDIKCKLTCTFV